MVGRLSIVVVLWRLRSSDRLPSTVDWIENEAFSYCYHLRLLVLLFSLPLPLLRLWVLNSGIKSISLSVDMSIQRLELAVTLLLELSFHILVGEKLNFD